MRNVDSNIKLPDNECYIGPANENALPIVSDELTMTEYDPYMKDFKDGMYVQNRASDNRYYLGTITYNSDLNMAIYKPTDKKGFEQAKLEQDKKDIRTIASFAADWTPADVAIDSASFIAGHDIITGEECNRGILAAGILLPGGLDSLGKGLAKKGVKQAAKHGDDVAEEAFKIGDDVYDATKTSYVKSIDDLKNTENFKDSALKYILEGEINKRGKAVGFHYEGFPTTKGNIIEGTKSLPDELGVYTGRVEVSGIPKTSNGGQSTFFPESWTAQDIVDAINQAYVNKTFVRGNTYIGTLPSGMKIEMFIDQYGNIISAYPKFRISRLEYV
ncbi:MULTISPECIES: EndoU domain-containing protein [Clostridium]|uniref:EndoU domain-containing protein n=1 Tax=Clostridium TaxID=1485 RepID=UPI0002CB4B4C|nr:MULTISPECIES: EndoU domain-containing protein [Clostridium]EMU55294.1 hypothetical protein CBDKU1_07200 [Clostridium butyricum DKU-01]MDU4589951.1 EndoU domain-containing protein [Clostridium sp.]